MRTSRVLFILISMATWRNGILNEEKTPDPAGCPSDQFLARLPDGTWDCLFCTLSCPPGTEEDTPCTRERDLQCRQCPDGTFNDGSTTACMNCSVCLHTRVVTNCTYKHNTVCKPNDNNDIWKWIVIGAAVCVIGILVAVVVLFYKWKREKPERKSETNPSNDESYKKMLKKNPIPLPRFKSGDVLIARGDFMPKKVNELQLFTGQEYEFLENSEQGWLWARSGDGKEGLVPNGFVYKKTLQTTTALSLL